MIAELALFWFVLLGSKLLLAGVALYLLLPRDRQCAVCDAELLPIAPPRGGRGIMRLAHLQLLWCVECDRQSLGRRRRDLGVVRRRPASPVPELRPR